ncbi:hypothetical protein [Thalassoglobus sp.]|uniref:hypothetical protein n=1 Tax=Thalassoglobus sp. TaxID=2795869 RepID=UPI003AA8C4DB
MLIQKVVLCAAFAIGIPATGHAQFGIPGFNPCNRCATPPVPVVRAPVCPQVQTTYRQEQVTTYQPVTRTHVRREAVSVNVPVTTHKQVTVDEGGYKMVWVPKLTTKTVAETKLQQQVQYRDVPYQVVENVPRVHTRLVPQQTVSYHAPRTVAIAKPCCQGNQFSAVPIPMTTTAAVPYYPQVTAQAPITPVPAAPQQSTAPADDGNWQKIPQRKAEANSKIELQSFQEQVTVTSPAQGMFSRPTSSNSALRAGQLR